LGRDPWDSAGTALPHSLGGLTRRRGDVAVPGFFASWCLGVTSTGQGLGVGSLEQRRDGAATFVEMRGRTDVLLAERISRKARRFGDGLG
jgi:hypothetical protein